MSSTDFEVRALLKSCAEGDADSRTKFQNSFGELIYNYPARAFRLPHDRAADFYIYVFENDRIFRRVEGFEARNDVQFKTYLNYYVLRDLFLEWQRTLKEPETISLATAISDDSGQSSRTLEDLLADPTPNGGEWLESGSDAPELKAFLEKLDPEKRLLLKLLHLADFDLSPQEIRFLCRKSGRFYREIITDIEEMRDRLSKKDEQLAALHAQLESTYGWILLYQKELEKISEQLNSLPEDSPHFSEHRRKKNELERKLVWRYRQRDQTLEKVRQFRVTTPYKDIARLLNAPIGTVCSLIARIREEICGVISKADVSREAVAM
jgi:RNA polymerase sigma factor (sigma-70 family)